MNSMASTTATASVTRPDTIKILAVDDDADNLLALQAILEPLQQDLMLARNGMEALKLCLENDFAAILLDVRMPELDGFETAQLIRQRNRSSRTPILFLTAYRSDEQLFRGYDLGAVDFLFKPIVPEVLQSKVSVFVELSRSEQMLRRQADELSRTERKFRTVLEAAPDAMVITDPSGRIELANSRADSLFGLTRESLLGKTIQSLIPDWQCPPLSIESIPETDQPQVRLMAVRKDGVRFPVDVRTSPFTTGDGMLLTTAVRDVTEQVLAEQKIQRINAELERRVQERTAALMRSNEALRQFAWAASHDLQEPIRTVMNYVRLLSDTTDGKLDEKEARMLGIIREHSHRLHRLFDALRQYIRVGEANQEWSLVDCKTSVEMAISNLSSIIESSGARVTHSSMPTIRSIEVLLVQVFQNLISNAIKYRSEETPEIRITGTASPEGWTLAVADNGMGIDPEYFDYIFGVFRRLHSDGNAGTGLGLAICKAALDRVGGRIWVESSLGSGSTFFIFLPQPVPEEHHMLRETGETVAE
jgi:PAS domain S-box-containing protein